MRLITALLLSVVTGSAVADDLTIAKIFGNPDLNGQRPRSLQVAPNGKHVTFLRGAADDQHRLDLWEYDVAAQQERKLVDATSLAEDAGKPSAAALARSERERTAGNSGVSHYRWAPDSGSLLFTEGDAVYLYTFGKAEQPIERLSKAGSNIIDARISPRGRYVSFVSDRNLWLIDLRRRHLRQLTHDGGGAIHNGEAEFVAQEEMGRAEGYWWAPDDSAIAFERFDESKVPIVQSAEFNATGIETLTQHYPAAGDPNVAVRLALVSIDAHGPTRWVDLGTDENIYLARVDWLQDSRRLLVQRETRDQRTLDVVLADARGSRVVTSEHSPTWVRLSDDLKPLKTQPDAFVWSSDRSGHRHLYLFGNDGQLRATLTQGDWDVDKVLGIDEKLGKVYFSANRDDPLQMQVYSASLDGGSAADPTRVSHGDGWHEAVFADNAEVYADTFSDPSTPPHVTLYRSDGSEIAVLESNRLDEHHPYWPYRNHHVVPEFGTVAAIDGQKLYWRLYRPAQFDPHTRYPVFFRFYGGPGRQMVNRAWGDLFDQYMARRGYVVFSLDNRGTPRRGRAFEDPIFRQLGEVEVQDQLAGIAYLKSLPYVDVSRIGCFGWSYGGYLSLMMLAKASSQFAGGVAVAPVTDWRLYDTHYTERYLDAPAQNARGYEASSVFPYLAGLTAPLFLAHGMADDNVRFANSTKLMSALQERGTQFELMTYPGGKHGLSTPAMRTHVYTAIANYFDRVVKGKTATH